jgi:flagellar basal-body rod protein FlgC
MFSTMDISASGLNAEQTRFRVIANNLANSDSFVRGADGKMTPYRRQQVVFSVGAAPGAREGVSVAKIVPDMSGFRKVYNPSHPYAGPDGFVNMPNVNQIVEMVDMIEASRAYEANATALDATKNIIANALRIIA